MGKDEILLGAGEVYLLNFEGDKILEDAEIETEKNNVGHCSGGFSIEYKPTKYEVVNQYDKVVKAFITKEEISAKTGLLTWKLKNLSMLSTGEYTEDTKGKKKKLLFTGKGSALSTVLLRFVHEKENGKKIRFTMIGQGGSGFALEFANKEVTVDAEIAAITKVDGFLASLEEELTEEEAKEIANTTDGFRELTIKSVEGTTSGTSKITVEPALRDGNSFKYKTGVSLSLPTFNQVCASGYIVWDGISDITSSAGQKIVIVEVDTENKAKGAGITDITVKA